MKYSILFLAMIASNAGATELKTYHMLPSGNCDRALPVYDDQVRKRPLAVVNEGTTNRFINCTFESLQQGDVKFFGVRYKNNSQVAHQVTCTGIVGFDEDAEYLTRTYNVNPGADRDFQWESAQGWKVPVALACNVLASGALTYTWVRHGQ